MNMFGLDFFKCVGVEAKQDDKPPSPPKSPYPTVGVGGAMVKDLVDEHYDDEVYLWCELVYNGGTDLELTGCGDIFVNHPPEWLDYIFDEGLFENDDFFNCGDLGECRMLKWAMENGIVHNQPFLICVSRPVTYRCGWEYEEYDISYDIDLLRVLKPRVCLSEFEQVLSDIAEVNRCIVKRSEENRKARWFKIDRMYIQSRSYFTPDDNYYGHMATPSGLSISLISTLHDVDRPELYCDALLASGRSDNGSTKEAFDELASEVRKHNSSITKAVLKRMKWRAI